MHTLKSGLLLCLVGMATVFAQTSVSLTGKVIDEEGKPVAGAEATLIQAGIKAVTNTDGSFTLLSPIGLIGLQGSGIFYPQPQIKNAVLFFSVPTGANQVVSVEMYNVGGKRTATVVSRSFSPGNYSVSLMAHNAFAEAPAGYYMVKTVINGKMTVGRMLFMPGRQGGTSAASTVQAIPLSKNAAVIDTILVKKSAYINYKKIVTSYTGSLPDILLKFVPVIPPTTAVIDSGTFQSAATITDSGAVIRFDLTNLPNPAFLDTLEINDVLILPPTADAPSGMIRKITSIARTAAAVTIQTTQATLSAAVETGSVDSVVIFDSAAVDRIDGMKKTSTGNGAISLSFTKLVLYDADGDTTTKNDQVTATGSVHMRPDYRLRIFIKEYKLKELYFTATVTDSATVTVGSNISLNVIDENSAKKKFATCILPTVKCLIGSAPVWIAPKIEMYAGVSGIVGQGVSAGCSYTAQFQSGLQYAAPNWSPINAATQHCTVPAPSFSQTADLKGYVQSQLTLYLYSLAGPYLAARGSLGFNASAAANPQWLLGCGLNLIGVAILPWCDNSIADVKMTLWNYFRPFAMAGPILVTATADVNQVVIINSSAYSRADSFNIYLASSQSLSISNYQTLPDGRKISKVKMPYSVNGLTLGKTYYFVVTAVDRETGIESSPSLVVSASPLDTLKAPTITTHPQSQTVTVGQSVTFSVVATGNPAPVRQWKKNGMDIFGATSSSFTISSAQMADAGTYTVTVSNSEGSVTSNGAVLTVNSAPGDSVTDIDGNVYHTVTIGTQVWMVENLKTTRYNDGTTIPLVTDTTAWGGLTTPGYCWYNNDAGTNKATYGALYNWYAVNTGKLAPTGWHVPKWEDWNTLLTYLGGGAAQQLKESGTSHWTSPNTGATNETGFTALPGGYRTSNGAFTSIGDYGYWWSATAYMPGLGDAIGMYYDDASVNRPVWNATYGVSVRCIRD